MKREERDKQRKERETNVRTVRMKETIKTNKKETLRNRGGEYHAACGP